MDERRYMYGRTEGRKERRKDGWMNGGTCKDGQKEGRKDGQGNRGQDRWKEGKERKEGGTKINNQ